MEYTIVRVTENLHVAISVVFHTQPCACEEDYRKCVTRHRKHSRDSTHAVGRMRPAFACPRLLCCSFVSTAYFTFHGARTGVVAMP